MAPVEPLLTASGIVVTDGNERAALAVVRSLGRAGYRVIVGSRTGRSLAGASRHAALDLPLPDALVDPEAFVTTLAEAVRTHRADILLPVSEASLLAVLGQRERFPGAAIPFPSLPIFQRICDKARVLQEAELVGLRVPRQVTVAMPGAILPYDRLRFPLVLKPSRSVSEGPGGRVKLGVKHIESADKLAPALEAQPPAAYPILLQERIVGTGIGVFLLLRNRSAIAVFGHRRIREKPPSGGVSVYRESVRPAPDLVRRSEALLARLDWEGVAMVEYKVDAKTGEPFLMEINGRFWGSLQLAVDAGADFPRWLVQLAEGTPWEQQPDYRLGVRSRWWWGDVDQMLTRLRRSPAELALPPDDPGLWRSLLAFLTLWRPGDRNEVFRWDDPAPCWRETRAWLRGLG